MESTCASQATNSVKKEQEMEALFPVLGSGRKLQNVELQDTGHSIRSSVNKFASQIKKPSHRRSPSPLNWFPRKKTDSFLKRKIRLLQEGGGMSLSLVETLGNANPHYTRIAREKIAAQEAARRAMEAHKTAMVEASWCRILQAARIQSKEAEYKLEKAELHAAEAFEEAKQMGVMMFDRPDCPRRSCEVSSSSATGGKSAHTVTASFETEFEVDREVAAAVRKAFIILANCSSSSNKEEFRDLLRKIRQNPDDYEALTVSPQCEFDHSSGLEPELHATNIGTEISEKHNEVSHRKSSYGILLECHEDNNSNSSKDLVNIMVDRLKNLHEDELSSLATIVATCGLNAALLEMKSSQDHENEHDDAQREMRRWSNVNQFTYASKKKKEDITNVPSLDKFLVKHVSRLEREVQEAQMSKKNDDILAEFDKHVSDDRPGQLKQTRTTSQSTLDLGSILIKHVSKLEREIQEAKNSQKQKPKDNHVTISGSISCSGGKYSSNHELVIEEPAYHEEERIIKLSEDLEQPDAELLELISLASADEKKGKGNLKCNKLVSKSLTEEMNLALELREITNGNISKSDCNKKMISHDVRDKLETRKSFSCQSRHGTNDFQQSSLDKILVKPVHWLEREKMKAMEERNVLSVKKMDRQLEKIESLDEILVKHQSRLEKTKLAAVQEGTGVVMQKRRQHVEKIDSLDEILVKHQSKLERVKLEATQNSENSIKIVDARREARERELQEAWGGLSLGNSLRPHLSKLEKDKAAWRRAEQEAKIRRREC